MKSNNLFTLPSVPPSLFGKAVVLWAAIFLTSCGGIIDMFEKKDDDDENKTPSYNIIPSNGGVFQTADFDPFAGLATLDSGEIDQVMTDYAGQINKLTYIMDMATSTGPGKCLSSLDLTGTDGKLKVQGSVDATTCYAAYDTSTTKIVYSVINYHFELECNADFSSYDGMELSELMDGNNIFTQCGDTTISYFEQISIGSVFSTTLTGSEVLVESNVAYSKNNGLDKPCTFTRVTGTDSYQGTCWYNSSDYTRNNGSLQSGSFHIESEAISQIYDSNTQNSFTSGTADIKVNGIQGTMTFNSGTLDWQTTTESGTVTY